MTYQDIANWCEKNVPMGQATDFNDWLSMCEEEFLNAGHFLPEESIVFIQKKWTKAHPDERITPPPPPRPPDDLTISKKLQRRFEKFPQDLQFTPSQLAKFTGTNKNTIRRELQEFVADGTLQRVSRGRYRLAP